VRLLFARTGAVEGDTLSLHDALPIYGEARGGRLPCGHVDGLGGAAAHAAVAGGAAEGDAMAARRQIGERDHLVRPDRLTTPAADTDGVAARLFRARGGRADREAAGGDRKSTRLNSSH